MYSLFYDPSGFCQNNEPVINFTTDYIIPKFEVFTKNKIDELYLIESTIIEWIQIIYEFWYEVGKPYSEGFDIWLQWLFQYYYELVLGESIEIVYLTWKP